MEYTRTMSWILIAVIAGLSSAEDQQVTGLIGKSIVLRCPLSGDRILWKDWVHNTGREPALIYDSQTEQITASHPNAANFEVVDGNRLKINKIRQEDAGEYLCQDGRRGEEYIMLDVVGRPFCTGHTQLVEGDPSTVSCNISYSGSNLPDLDWYLDGSKALKSEDNSEIGLLQRAYKISSADWTLDGKQLVCKMRLGEYEEQCALDMHVQYMVRDLTVSSADTHTWRVGHVVECKARGNPQPRVTLSAEGIPAVQSQVTGDGLVVESFVIPQDWQGKQVEVKCMASNTVDGVVETLEKTNTYSVLDAVQSTAAPTAPGTATASSNVAGIIAAVVIIALVVVVIVIAVVCVKRKSSNKPKGAKPVPTKEDEIRALESGKA